MCLFIFCCSIIQVLVLPFLALLLSCMCILQYADPLVLDFQFIYDGYIPYWFGVNDTDAHS